MSDDLSRKLSDRFEIVSQLGSGGMGTVYKARDSALNKFVALKILKFSSMNLEKQALRFQKEAKAAACLKHESIVTVMDFGFAEDQTPYMVMELIEGRTLKSMLESDGPLDPRSAVAIFSQVARALSHAHSKAIVHRDLKPANILVATHAEGNLAKLFDFGIAQINAPDKSMELTHTRTVMGTPAYMSPEQARGQEADARSDIYSFGCVMFETLTGSPPFVDSNPVSLLQMQMETPPPAVSERAANQIPPALEEIIERCLAKDPALRYPSADALLIDLENFVSDLDNAVSDLENVPTEQLRDRVLSNGDSKHSETEQTAGAHEDTAGGAYRKEKNGLRAKTAFIIAAIAVFATCIVSAQLVGLFQPIEKQTPSPPMQQLDTFNLGYENLTVAHSASGEALLTVSSDDEDSRRRLSTRLNEKVDHIVCDLAPSYACMREIVRFRNLDKLTIRKNPDIKSLKLVEHLKDLRSLSLRSATIDADKLKVISGCRSLENISLENCTVDGEALTSLARLKKLRILKLKNSDVSSDYIEAISHLPGLLLLELRSMSIGDAECRELSRLQLRELNLESNPLTGVGLMYFAEMPALRKLTLNNCVNVSLEDLEELKRRRGVPDLEIVMKEAEFVAQTREPSQLKPALENNYLDKVVKSKDGYRGLDLRGDTSLSVEEIKRLKNLGLNILDVASTGLNDNGLIAISEISTLRQIDISDNDITASGIEALKSIPHLNSICLGKPGRDVTAHDIKALCTILSLEQIIIQDCRSINVPALASLSKLKNLTHLIIRNVNLADADLTFLVKLKALNSLGLENTGIGDGGVAQLSNLKDLRILYLNENSIISDSALDSLVKLPSLVRLELDDCPGITDAGRLRFNQTVLSKRKLRILKPEG